MRAKFLSLDQRPLGQFVARDASWKPEVIFDPRAATRLPTHRHHIQNQCSEAFRCAVHSSCESSWAATRDHQVKDATG